MKTNPGGQLAPSEVVGRDDLISELTLLIDRQSVIITAERRTGKTQAIKKLQAEGHADWLILYRDLESITAPIEFSQTLLADLYPYLNSGQRFTQWVGDMVTKLGGAQVGPVKLPNFPASDWKQVLIDTLAHVSEQIGSKKIVLLWDELPMMLQKFGDQEAMEVLDVLRHIRQTHANVRMIYTGSIGLHHVLRALKEKGYVNAPVNDMHQLELPPLANPHGGNLARELMKGEGIAWDNDDTPDYLAAEVDGIPFYIHHVVDQLRTGGRKLATAPIIDSTIKNAIVGSVDVWELKHYADRVATYYGESAKKPVLALLDSLMASDVPISVGDIINRTSGQHPEVDSEQWRSWLEDLTRDHYLIRDRDTGAYGYRYLLIRRWWRWARSI